MSDCFEHADMPFDEINELGDIVKNEEYKVDMDFVVEDMKLEVDAKPENSGAPVYIKDECVESETDTVGSSVCSVSSVNSGQPSSHLYNHLSSNCSEANAEKDLQLEKPFLCQVCGERFAKKYELNGHRKKHSRKFSNAENSVGEKSLPHGEIVACGICGKGFEHVVELKCHATTHLAPKPSICKACGKEFPWGESFVANNKEMVRCGLCNESQLPSTFRAHLRRHVNEHYMGEHEPREDDKKPSNTPVVKHLFSCTTCMIPFINQNSYENHIKTHHSFTCYECGKVFNCRNQLRKHSRTHLNKIKPVETIPCESCPKEILWTDYLKKHSMIDSGNPRFYCRRCKRTFNQTAFRSHLLQQREEHTVLCEECDDDESGIPASNSLYWCKNCGEVFTDRGSLKTHLQTHPKCAFSCEVCDKVFNMKGDLKHHIKTLHSKVSCNICEKIFQNYSCLRVHYGIAHSENFSCGCCNKRFRHKSRLKEHVTRHSGIKPLQCHLCDKKYRSRTGLRCHLRTHTQEKPFVCGKQFTLQQNMKKHDSVRCEENK